MKRHDIRGLVAALLLPVPLVMLMLGILPLERWASAPVDARVSPVLEFEARTQLQSYGHYCRTSSRCEPPLGCLEDMRAGTAYCTDSECTTDRECPEGQQCRSLATRGGGPLVRFCILLGERKEGERCFHLPSDSEGACGPNLLCAGDGWCARPCRIDDLHGCPEGFRCTDVTPEPACLPTCEARGCPQGQRCVRQEDGVSVCAVTYGPDCQSDPSCARCEADIFPPYPGEAWMECVQRCGKPGDPPCPDGSICDIGTCARVCDRKVPGVCGEGFFCRRGVADKPSHCEPNWMRPKRKHSP